jgi:hypothetical protein
MGYLDPHQNVLKTAGSLQVDRSFSNRGREVDGITIPYIAAPAFVGREAKMTVFEPFLRYLALGPNVLKRLAPFRVPEVFQTVAGRLTGSKFPTFQHQLLWGGKQK